MQRATYGVVFLCLTSLAPATTRGQPTVTVRSGPRAVLPRAEEIALARSAAPAAVSDSATVYVFTGHGYDVAVRGTSGGACYVSRGWVEALEPHCFDGEGTATILPMEMHRVVLLHQGKTDADADREIGDGLRTGKFRLPRRPAVSYMMSAEQRLVAPNGQVTGAYRPFMLIYYPYLSDADIGMVGNRKAGDPGMGGSGTATSAITVFVAQAVPLRRGRA